ncbi:putative signaling protein [bacterium HR40]|nr:putative signaling protein [bacterium HR40]
MILADLRRLWLPAGLLLALAVFSAGIVGSNWRLQKAHEASLRRGGEAAWLACQLELELQRLLRAAEAYVGAPARDRRATLALRLEALHDRVRSAAAGESGELLRDSPESARVLAGLEPLLRTGGAVVASSFPDPRAVTSLAGQLATFEVPLHRVALAAQDESTRRRMELERRLADPLFANRASTIGLMITFLLLLLLLWREGLGTRRALARSLEATRSARHLAEHDELTGLANRRLFLALLERTLAAVRRGETQAALLLLDLDRFKTVNDTLGHAAGDRLLAMVAARLRSQVRHEDLVARLGGDEFALLEVGAADPETALGLATRLVEAIAQPYELEGRRIAIGASVGIALLGPNARGTEELLKQADVALYQAKQTGPIVLFQPPPESGGKPS